MSQPIRLVVARPESELARLVRAGREERPASKLPSRILSGLAGSAATMAAGGASATAGALASAGPASSSLWLLGAKGLAIGVLAGGALAAGASAIFAPTPEPSRAAAPASRSAPGRPAAVEIPVPVAAPAAVASPLPVHPQSPQPPSAAPAAPPPEENHATPRLGREAALIEAARHALSAGNPSLALQSLAEYRSLPVTGTLEREARVLRIEALVQRGELSEARSLAAAYLREFPRDAHHARLRALQLPEAPRGSISEFDDTEGSGK
jgi:hypothetical protein